jgi:SAM-dependent methyltransferase
MNRRQILAIYDEEYARTYDERYILNEHYRKKSEFETQVLAGLLQDGGEWLDVACGTGYFLSRFPGVRRAGFDISHAMLAVARQANPDALFLEERDFTDDVPEWHGRWDLVSCMWYSYGLVESVSDVERLIRKFASWLSPRGACFVPLCDPEYLGRVKVPYVTPNAGFPPGRLLITGVTWTWEEDSGKAHVNMVAPPVEHMITIFERYFRDVEVVDYPRFRWLGRHRRKGLIGRAPAIPAESDRDTASQA